MSDLGNFFAVMASFVLFVACFVGAWMAGHWLTQKSRASRLAAIDKRLLRFSVNTRKWTEAQADEYYALLAERANLQAQLRLPAPMAA